MALISPSDQQNLRESFAEMTRAVRLLFFTRALDCDTCPQTRRILDELPPLSDQITIEEVNFILDGDTARQYGVDRAPAVAIQYQGSQGSRGSQGSPGSAGSEGSSSHFENFANPNPANLENPANRANPANPANRWVDSRIRFLGAPAGYEFISLVQAVLLAGGRRSILSEESRGRIAAVDRPVTMHVFTTPT